LERGREERVATGSTAAVIAGGVTFDTLIEKSGSP